MEFRLGKHLRHVHQNLERGSFMKVVFNLQWPEGKQLSSLALGEQVIDLRSLVQYKLERRNSLFYKLLFRFFRIPYLCIHKNSVFILYYFWWSSLEEYVKSLSSLWYCGHARIDLKHRLLNHYRGVQVEITWFANLVVISFILKVIH